MAENTLVQAVMLLAERLKESEHGFLLVFRVL